MVGIACVVCIRCSRTEAAFVCRVDAPVYWRRGALWLQGIRSFVCFRFRSNVFLGGGRGGQRVIGWWPAAPRGPVLVFAEGGGKTAERSSSSSSSKQQRRGNSRRYCWAGTGRGPQRHSPPSPCRRAPRHVPPPHVRQLLHRAISASPLLYSANARIKFI
jgi:hypothetical protein